MKATIIEHGGEELLAAVNTGHVEPRKISQILLTLVGWQIEAQNIHYAGSGTLEAGAIRPASRNHFGSR